MNTMRKIIRGPCVYKPAMWELSTFVGLDCFELHVVMV